MSDTTPLAAPDTEPIDIGASGDFREGRGRQVDVKGRPLSIFRHEGILYALDHHCYHAGGPLAMGDIEELVVGPNKKGNSDSTSQLHPCVVCPWHKYRISLKTGEGIYVHSDPFAAAGSKTQKQVKSRGLKQRTHQIHQDDNGRVMVKLNLADDVKFESDYYASEDFLQLMRSRKD